MILKKYQKVVQVATQMQKSVEHKYNFKKHSLSNISFLLCEMCTEFGRNLEDDMQSDTSRKFERFLIVQCQASREVPDGTEHWFDYGKALADGRIINDVRM